MISSGMSRVWPKSLYNLCDWKAHTSFLLLNTFPLTRYPDFPRIPWLACEGPGDKHQVIPWAAGALHRPQTFSIDCSRLFLSQSPNGPSSLFFKATSEIIQERQSWSERAVTAGGHSCKFGPEHIVLPTADAFR